MLRTNYKQLDFRGRERLNAGKGTEACSMKSCEFTYCTCKRLVPVCRLYPLCSVLTETDQS